MPGSKAESGLTQTAPSPIVTRLRMKHCILLITSLLLPVAAQALSRVELAQGSVLEVQVIDEKPDRIVVDLGFTVLAIPRDSVIDIRDADASGATDDEPGKNLYRTDAAAPLMPLKELADQVGEAVVTVRTPVGLGSGFIIHPAGYIVTNDHVVAGEHQISVTLFERGEGGELAKTQYENVRIVATSPEWDLALLKIEVDEDRRFQTVPLGQSDELRQGQTVFAIGNPLGLERSVSEGIVSIKNRLIDGRLFIQTTAQINPGNSGGPLFNLRGEVIGVNNMKVTGFGAEGLGFAVPATILERFLLNRDAFAFDPRNPNSGFRYNSPPSIVTSKKDTTE